MTAVDQVLLATPRSFCAGVEMAIKALVSMVRVFDPPVYCYHQIVHNQVVVDRFQRAGVVFVDDIDEVPAGAPLMLSAHGSAPEVVRAAHARSDVVVDAVCPLVKKVHHEVRQRARRGHTVIYTGHPDHDEAIGTMAVAPEDTHLVQGPEELAELPPVDGPVAFLAQTTLAVDEWQATLDAARDRFGDVWLPGRSDLCFATTNRQAAVRAMAPRCDAVVIIGSANSSNTLALAKVARHTSRARILRVNGPDEVPAGLRGTVGVTAGASAPEAVVRRVVDRLEPQQGVEVVDVTTEDEYFPPPRELRDLLRSAGAAAHLDGDPSRAASDVLQELEAGTVTHHLTAHADQVDRHMALVVEEVTDPRLRGLIGYHLGWRDEHLEPLPVGAGQGGKKLRSALGILVHRAVDPTAGPLEPVLPLAAAVELLHNWSLVHDDIEDGDTTRRGRPALWTVCGVAQAINAGDCIQALASRSLLQLGPAGVPETTVATLMAELAATAAELTVGQMRDLAFETTTDIHASDYLEMISGKTAALMGYATYAAALVAGADPAAADAYRDVGRQLGLGFQVRDDILGIWGTDGETGKPIGADIRRRKKSLPIVLALEHAGPADRGLLEEIYTRDAPPEPADESTVRQVLERCRSRDLAQDRARQHRDAALEALDRAAGAGGPTERSPLSALRALATFVTERTH